MENRSYLSYKLTDTLSFTGISPMNTAASIALLSACPFVSLAAVPVTFSETVLEAAGPKGPLKGTLLTPNSKPTAVVLIIPGSGPTDRDGNNPLGVNASPYRLLAEGLAAKGFATLRIDKRGMFASAMAVEDGNAVAMAVSLKQGLLRARSGRCSYIISLIKRVHIVNINDAMEGID
jgi:hypothetical protein